MTPSSLIVSAARPYGVEAASNTGSMPEAARSLACLRVCDDDEHAGWGRWGGECVPRLAPAVDDFGCDLLGLYPDEAHREDSGEDCDYDHDSLDRLGSLGDGAYRTRESDDMRSG